MRKEVIRQETLRYLGCGSAAADEQSLQMADRAIKLLLEKCRPRNTYTVIGIKAESESIRLENGMTFFSESLARVMSGCSRMLVFGATLGIEADLLIKRETAKNVAMGAVLQAASAACIEEYCDDTQALIGRESFLKGEALGDRFSPGYGDFALECQKDIFAVLDCERKIGLTLTENCIMIPSKSVTAVIPIGGSCGRQLGCRYCEKTDCEYRRKDDLRR